MSDWYPQIVRVAKTIKHPKADSLSIVTTSVGDYPIVTKLDEYKPGDMAAYIPIDTIVPDVEKFYFLCPKHEGNIIPKFEIGSVPERYRRIKAKKLRGQYSQGMLVGIPNYRNDVGIFARALYFVLSLFAILYRKIPKLPKWNKQWYEYKLGDSVVDIFNLTKWEEEEEDNITGLPKEKRARGETEKKPVGWDIPYYDKEGLRKHFSSLQDGEEVILTEKIHGANAAYCHDGEKLWVRSRSFFKRDIITFTDGDNVEHQIESTDQWWDIARRLKLEEKLKEYPFLVVFGEVAGQVKGFRYDSEIKDGKLETCLYVFDVWDIKAARYWDYDDKVALFKKLGLTPAPELYRGPWNKENIFQFAEGKTTTSGNHIREGFVLNVPKERFDPKMNNRLTMKLVGEGYNLQK
jgi:RNA ligase (TIGR02306 family)